MSVPSEAAVSAARGVVVELATMLDADYPPAETADYVDEVQARRLDTGLGVDCASVEVQRRIELALSLGGE